MVPMDTDDERVTAGQVGAGLASLAEAWARDTAFCAVGLFSFVVVIAGFADSGAAMAVLGGVAGVVAFALPLYAVVRRLGAGRIWLAILVGVVLDVIAVVVFTSS
jgi:hypothetical protein